MTEKTQFVNRDHTLYDRFTVETNSLVPNHIDLFAFPLGSPGKTIADTNMVHPGFLPRPQLFEIKRIFVLFADSCHEEDLQQMETFSLSINVADRIWFRGPVRRFRLNHWNLQQILSKEELKEAFEINEPQRQSWYYVYNFEYPIIFEDLWFSVNLSGRGFQTRPAYRGGAGIDFTVCLDGVLTDALH